jgi:hypothetical protein
VNRKKAYIFTSLYEWEKHFSARHKKGYWRHKKTGITVWERPYVNDELEHEDDSTEASEVEPLSSGDYVFVKYVGSVEGVDEDATVEGELKK